MASQTHVQAYAMQDANQPADWPLHITSLASYLPSAVTLFDSPIPNLIAYIAHSLDRETSTLPGITIEGWEAASEFTSSATFLLFLLRD